MQKLSALEIKEMFLKPNPMIISKEDSIDYNQIKGKEMIAFFDENKMNEIDIIGSGQSIFIVNDDEKDNTKIGLNYIESTNLSLYFNDNKLQDITYQIKPNSLITPYEKIKEEIASDPLEQLKNEFMEPEVLARNKNKNQIYHNL